jgi:spore maturation protein CgeB
MRIARVANFFPEYVNWLYGRRPGLADLPYEDQKAAVLDDFFFFGGSWEYWLGRAGEEAEVIPFGIPQLAAAFRREYGVRSDKGEMAATIEILKRIAPDVLWFGTIERWTAEKVREIRNQIPSIRAVIGMAGVDVFHNAVLGEVDGFLTCMKGLASRLQAEGKLAAFMAHAFDPRVIEKLGPVGPKTGLSFFGNVYSGSHLHDVRRQVLNALAVRCGLRAYSHLPDAGQIRGIGRHLRLLAAYGAGRTLRRLGVLDLVPGASALRRAAEWPAPPIRAEADLLARIARPPLYGLAMYREMSRSLSTVNVHVGVAGPHAASLRLFEASGVGVALLSDWKADMPEYFEPDREIACFRSVEDAVDKATYLLDHPAEAEAMGVRAQQRTLAHHTYERRVPIVIDMIKRALAHAP